MAELSKACLTRCAKLGFTPPFLVDLSRFGDKAKQGLRDYIAAKHHGTMGWIEETEARRNHPQNLWPEAKTAIVVGMNYGPETDPMLSLIHI